MTLKYPAPRGGMPGIENGLPKFAQKAATARYNGRLSNEELWRVCNNQIRVQHQSTDSGMSYKLGALDEYSSVEQCALDGLGKIGGSI